MEILKSAVILVIGFVLLIKGADYFVEGSSSVAKKFKVPSLIIGMTIVAMGTSLPELAVSVTAAMAGNNTLAVSNVAGSNIFNLMVVCGACALFTPLTIEKNTLMKEFPFSILCAGLLVVMGYLGMSLGRVDGVILLVIFAVYLFWMIQSAKKARTSGDKLEAEEEALAEEEIKILPMWKCIVFIIGGMIAIKFGGDFVVDGASAIAAGFGLSQTLIGLTIVALGTSLPELVTSIVAARKDEVDMALGNVIGSNIFNILLIFRIHILPLTFHTNCSLLFKYLLFSNACFTIIASPDDIFSFSKSDLFNGIYSNILSSFSASDSISSILKSTPEFSAKMIISKLLSLIYLLIFF